MERISCVNYLRETIIDKPSRSPGPYGPWRIKTQEVVYQDPFLKVELDQVVRPDQKDGQHVVAFLKPGVCVLAIDHENHVYLTHEFHYGVGRHTLEGVSGGIEPDE